LREGAVVEGGEVLGGCCGGVHGGGGWHGLGGIPTAEKLVSRRRWGLGRDKSRIPACASMTFGGLAGESIFLVV
jgi:hypothetical protein